MDPTKASIDQLVDQLLAAFEQARQGRNPAREDLEHFIKALLDSVADRAPASPAPRRRSGAKRPSTSEGA
jgi:hypothetical protein